MPKAKKIVRTNNSLLIISKNLLLSSLDWQKYDFSLSKNISGFNYCITDIEKPFSLSKYPLSPSAKVLFISSNKSPRNCQYPCQVITRPNPYDSSVLPYLINHLLNPNLYSHHPDNSFSYTRKYRPPFFRLFFAILFSILFLFSVILFSPYANFQCQYSRLTGSPRLTGKCQVAGTINRLTESLLPARTFSLFNSLSQVSLDFNKLDLMVSRRQNPGLLLTQLQTDLSLLQSDLKVSQRSIIFRNLPVSRLVSQSETQTAFINTFIRLQSLFKSPFDIFFIVRDNFDLDSAGGKPLGEYGVSVDNRGFLRRVETPSPVLTIQLPLSTLYLLTHPQGPNPDFASVYQQQLQLSPLHGLADFSDSLFSGLMDKINLSWQDQGPELTYHFINLLNQGAIAIDSFAFPVPACPDSAACVTDQFDFIRENTSSFKPDLFLHVVKAINVDINPEKINYAMNLGVSYDPPKSAWPAGKASYLFKILYPPDLLLVSTSPHPVASRFLDRLLLSYAFTLIPKQNYDFKLNFSRPNPASGQLKYTLVFPHQIAAQNEELEVTVSYPQNWFVFVSPKPAVASPGRLEYNLDTDKSNLVTLDLIPPQL